MVAGSSSRGGDDKVATYVVVLRAAWSFGAPLAKRLTLHCGATGCFRQASQSPRAATSPAAQLCGIIGRMVTGEAIQRGAAESAPIRVLIVDNEAPHAQAVAESLERVGYDCTVATSGPQGAAS